MIYEWLVTVRGYELDSFSHVNNAVYLQYMEQARWEIFRLKNLYDYFSRHDLILVITENHIRYIQEAKIFDELVVKTELKRTPPYLVFKHAIYNCQSAGKITKATVKTLLVDRDRIAHDIPDEFLD